MSKRTADDTKQAGKPASAAKSDEPKAYERSAADLAEVNAFAKRRDAMAVKPLPAIQVRHAEAACEVSFKHPDINVASSHLGNALGTADMRLVDGHLDRLIQLAATNGKINTKRFDCLLATVRAVGARDEIEGLLAVQMAAVHDATMTAAQRLGQAEYTDHQDSAANALTKLARTFAGQIETLKRHRSTGEQSIKVQHVTVTGGQTVVAGTVQTGGAGGGVEKNGNQSHEPYSPAQQSTPLLSHVETVPFSMPCAGSAGKDGVPLPRRESGRAQGRA